MPLSYDDDHDISTRLSDILLQATPTIPIQRLIYKWWVSSIHVDWRVTTFATTLFLTICVHKNRSNDLMCIYIYTGKRTDFCIGCVVLTPS